MAKQVKIRSKQQILADIVRKMSNNTDVSSFDAGSDLVTLAEAFADSIGQTEATVLDILEEGNLDSLVGTALDKKAVSSRIPNGQGGFGRKPALQASGPVTIGSAFTKIAANLYAGKPAPFVGATTIFLDDASAAPSTGGIYLGRNTVDRFEGPIPYSSVVNSGSFWTVTLSQPLTKNHLNSDQVIFAQGGDRSVPAGTIVQVRSNSERPAINYTTIEDLVIPDGEDSGIVNVISSSFGDVGNAQVNSISQFSGSPFPGATVTNNTAFRNGQSVENDEDLRLRIKNYPFTLSRGTATSIESAIQGAIDPDSGRSIQSSTVVSPVEPGDPARVFIDDGSGLEPTFSNQSTELLLRASSGVETKFRTAQFPISSVVAEGSETAPYTLNASMVIRVEVDNIVEEYTITPSNYSNLNSATTYEVIRDLNSQSNLLGFRTIDNGTRIVAIDLSGESESLLITSGDLQKALGLPTDELRPIYLYKDSTLLSFKGKTATIETISRNLWNLSESDLQDISIIVDGVTQTFSINDSDFLEFSSNISNATIDSWLTVFSRKVAGVRFSSSGQIIVMSTYNALSSSGSISIPELKADGTPQLWIGDDKMWTPISSGGSLSDVGSEKDFNFNRFTGEIELLAKPDVNSSIEIATPDTRAHARSNISDNGLFSLDPNVATVGNSKLIVGFDGTFAVRQVPVASGVEFTVSIPDSINARNIVRLTSNDAGVFFETQVGDYLYTLTDVAALGTLYPTALEGFYRVKSRGFSTTATDTASFGLLGSTNTYASALASVALDSDIVTVSILDHNLKTGDLVTVTTASDIGGITSGDLSSVNTSITVLDDDRFTYQAASSATSTTNGTLDFIGTNRITVAHSAHGYNSGALVDIVVGTGFGGISSGDLTVSGASIELIDTGSYAYRAATAATSSASGETITSITLKADTWIEFEVSAPTQTDWDAADGITYGLTKNMFHMFKSDNATPQLIDFGPSVSTESVDTIVSSINSQINVGEAVKYSPKQLEIRSKKFSSTGTMGILAVIGNSTSLYDTPATFGAIQGHSGFSVGSKTQGNTPVISDVKDPGTLASGYATRSNLFVDQNITTVTTKDVSPVIQSPTAFNTEYPVGFQQLWLTGRGEGFTARVYNNQTTAPYTGIMTKESALTPLDTFDDTQTSTVNLDRYANLGIRLQDTPLNNHDNLVVEMDLDSTNKTINIPMFKKSTIMDMDALSGSGKGQVVSFRLLDQDDSNLPFFDLTSVYKDFDFRDFKILTRSVGVYQNDASDRSMIIRSADYGSPSQLRFSIRYPSEPSLDDFITTHTTDFFNNRARLNLIVTMPSDDVIAGSVLSAGSYRVKSTANGDLFDWRISSPNLNSGSNYVAGNILAIRGSTSLVGGYEILSTAGGPYLSSSATTSVGSQSVSMTIAAHGLETGDLISVITANPIGGISATDLSVSNAVVTVFGVNSFSFEANAAATSVDTASIDTINAGIVTVKAPGSGGLTGTEIFLASSAPISTFALLDKTIDDIADSVNNYLVNSPIASIETSGSDISTNFVTKATYCLYTNPAGAYTGSDLSGALNHHSFECNYSGSAGIFQYDSSVITANGIKATVQSDDSLFPNATQVGTSLYSPIGETVMIVPTNTKSITEWMRFRAVSSLNIIGDIDRIEDDSKIQISSSSGGSAGAVNVTGVNANAVSTAVIGNASFSNESLKVSALNANVRSLANGQLVRIENSINSEILRSYRAAPETANITQSNLPNINDYFRSGNSVKYIRVNATTGRLIFLREGKGISQTESLDVGNDITLTSLGNGLVQVTGAVGTSGDPLSGKLNARVGDMMYVQPSSPFTVDIRNKILPISGITNSANPEYVGYPVLHVEDDNNIIILAPNITTFSTVALTSAEDLVFIPAVYNEKNIRTNHQEGAKFDLPYGDGKAWFLIKSLGDGLVSFHLQNSASESTDDMRLDDLIVNTDDFLVLGDGFNPANQGSHRIVAHNGRNMIIAHIPSGGTDEIIDLDSVSNGGQGDRKWRVGPLEGDNRSVKVISSDSVRIGDFLRISSPSVATQWFNDVFFGSWEITGMGFQAFDYSAAALPHGTTSGVYDQAYFAPYIDFTMVDAPISITDGAGSHVDSFIIGDNTSSLGFTEGSPFIGHKMISGHALNPQNTENRDLYLRPKSSNQKVSGTFGSSIVGLSKIGFEERTFLGIDGYKSYAGLIRQAHRIIDGLPSNTNLFPGQKAAGAVIEVQTSLLRFISVNLQVRPADGVTLNSISDLIKSSISGYVNDLGVGKPVVISEIQRVVQSLPGVFSVTVTGTLPAAFDDRIVVSDQEKARILNASEDITIG